MADEDHRSGREGVEDLEQVVGVAMQAAILGAVVGGQVGAAAADQIEGKGAETILVGRREEAPHGLVAAEAVREYHGCRSGTRDTHVVTQLQMGAHGFRLGS